MVFYANNRSITVTFASGTLPLFWVAGEGALMRSACIDRFIIRLWKEFHFSSSKFSYQNIN